MILVIKAKEEVATKDLVADMVPLVVLAEEDGQLVVQTQLNYLLRQM